MEQKSSLIPQQLLMDFLNRYGVLKLEMLLWQITTLQLESTELAQKFTLISSQVEIERKLITNLVIFMEAVLYQPQMDREHLHSQELEMDY